MIMVNNMIRHCNRTANIRHQCRKITLLSCHRCLINTGVEKMNNISLQILTFYHPIFRSKSKCWDSSALLLYREYKRGKYHCTVDLLFDQFGISCMTTVNFCFYLQNRLIQTSQTAGQWYTDTPFSIPCSLISLPLVRPTLDSVTQ